MVKSVDSWCQFATSCPLQTATAQSHRSVVIQMSSGSNPFIGRVPPPSYLDYLVGGNGAPFPFPLDLLL